MYYKQSLSQESKLFKKMLLPVNILNSLMKQLEMNQLIICPIHQQVFDYFRRLFQNPRQNDFFQRINSIYSWYINEKL